MDFYKHASYIAFSEALKNSLKNKTNTLLVSVPGMSVSFYIQKFLEKEDNKVFKYIKDDKESLLEFNILDLNFDKNEKALEIAEKYLKLADLNQKFALVVNTPSLLDSLKFIESTLGNHFYSSYYFKVLDKDLITIFGQILKSNLDKTEIDRIYELSGGLTRIVKFLITHKSYIDKSSQKIIEDLDFRRVFLPTAHIIEDSDDEVLIKLGIKNKDEFIGEILKDYFKTRPIKQNIDIKINSDLTFFEKDKLNGESLLKIEKYVIEGAIDNNGVVTKEKIADFKWGEGGYDEYSDQAIAKTVFRLKKKLKIYTIDPIQGYGYKIVEK